MELQGTPGNRIRAAVTNAGVREMGGCGVPETLMRTLLLFRQYPIFMPRLFYRSIVKLMQIHELPFDFGRSQCS